MSVEEEDPPLLPVPDPDTGVPGPRHYVLPVHVYGPDMVVMAPQCPHLQHAATVIHLYCLVQQPHYNLTVQCYVCSSIK